MSVVIWHIKHKFNRLYYITHCFYVKWILLCICPDWGIDLDSSQISFRFWRLWWTSCRCYRKCVRTSKAKIKVSVFFLSWMPYLIFRYLCEIDNFHNVRQSNQLEIMKGGILFYPPGFDWIKKHGLSYHCLMSYNQLMTTFFLCKISKCFWKAGAVKINAPMHAITFFQFNAAYVFFLPPFS